MVVAIAQDTLHLRNAELKCAQRAWYCGSSGGVMDHEEDDGICVDCCNVGGGGRHFTTRAGKSSVRGS